MVQLFAASGRLALPCSPLTYPSWFLCRLSIWSFLLVAGFLVVDSSRDDLILYLVCVETADDPRILSTTFSNCTQSLPLILPTKRSSICLHKREMQLANYTYYISWTRILRRGMCRFHLLCLRNVAFTSFVLRNVSLSSVASWDVSFPVHVSHIRSSLRTSREDETVHFGCNAGTCTGCPRNVLVYLYFCLPIDLTFTLHCYSHTYKQIRNILILSRNNTQIVRYCKKAIKDNARTLRLKQFAPSKLFSANAFENWIFYGQKSLCW